jgi:hypothetical protein
MNVNNIDKKDLKIVNTICLEMQQSLNFVPDKIETKCLNLNNFKIKVDNYVNLCILKL